MQNNFMKKLSGMMGGNKNQTFARSNKIETRDNDEDFLQ
jgi:hypothetical protein